MIVNKRNMIFCLVLIPVFSYMVFGTIYGYYLYFISLLMLFFYLGVNHPTFDHTSLIITTIVFFAIVVGGVNTIIGINDLENFFLYTLMGISYIFAIFAGRGFSRNTLSGVLILAFIGFSEILLLIPRIFLVGLDTRTSLSFTFLLPYIFLILKPNRLGFLIFTFVSIFYFLSIFLSGLRSVLIPGLIIYIISIIYLYRSYGLSGFTGNKRKFLFVVPLFFLALFGVGLNLFNVKERVVNATNIVVVRMEQTLLNPDGVRLDPKEGRWEESEHALDEFKKHATLLNYFIGMGYGFSFIDYSRDGELSAHVHLTPIAFFVRHGILGIFLYLVLFYGVLRVILSQNISIQEKTALTLWFTSSFFYGALILPTFWFFWAYLYASSKK